jgi:hypothetical protein
VARLCFSTTFPGMQLVQKGDLATFWSEFAAPIRDRMAVCNRYCGISHSVRKTSASLPVVA